MGGYAANLDRDLDRDRDRKLTWMNRMDRIRGAPRRQLGIEKMCLSTPMRRGEACLAQGEACLYVARGQMALRHEFSDLMWNPFGVRPYG